MRFGLSKHSRLEVHASSSSPRKLATSLHLKFRTLQTEGLLFYAGDAPRRDFLALWLQQGHLNLAFDLGSGLAHLKTLGKYSDGRFHTLSAARDLQHGLLLVSDRSNRTVVEQIRGASRGAASSLTLVEPFYFGGMPDAEIQRFVIRLSD